MRTVLRFIRGVFLVGTSETQDPQKRRLLLLALIGLILLSGAWVITRFLPTPTPAQPQAVRPESQASEPPSSPAPTASEKASRETSITTSQAGVDLPVYPEAIASSVVSKSGQGEGAAWYEVSFATRDPYERVVQFYRKEAGERAKTYMSASAKVRSTLIAIGPFKDQTTVTISREVGDPETKVVILRNFVTLEEKPGEGRGSKVE